jgi:hypothetical protein
MGVPMIASFTQRPSGTEIAKRAWDSTLAGMRAMPALFLAAFFVAILLALALIYLRPDHLTQSGYLPSPLDLAIAVANILAWSALTAPVAVAMHRFVLLGQTTTDVLSFAPRHTKLFFLWAVALQLVFDTVQGASGLLFSHYFIFLRVLAVIAVLMASVHLAMIFPAVAIEDGDDDWQARLAKSWRQMEGNFWLFIRAAIVTFLPMIVLWVIVIIVMALFGMMARGIIDESFPVLPRLWLSATLAVLAVLSIALGAALASWTYAWARASGQAQSAQTATSTVT